MLELSHVTKYYGSQRVVNDVSLNVGEGKTLVLLGKSGSGKTTLLKMVNRLVDPDSGSISINGQNTHLLPKEALRRNIGYVIQASGLFPHYTVARNIATVPELLGWPSPRISSRVDELIEKMGLPADMADKYPHELSGGQQQRVGVARALAAYPALLLMDEPFGALDPLTRKDVHQYFQTLEVFRGTTKIIVTHDVKEAFLLADHIALLHNGLVMEHNTPKRLLFQPVTAFTRGFLGDERWNLKLSLVKVKDVLPLLNWQEKAIDASPFIDIESTNFAYLFSQPAAAQVLSLIEKNSVVGYASILDLQQAFIKYDLQESSN